MGVLFGFFFGWMIGARGGKDGYDDVVSAAKEVLTSDEMALLKSAVREHAGYALAQTAEWLKGNESPATLVNNTVERVHQMLSQPNRD